MALRSRVRTFRDGPSPTREKQIPEWIGLGGAIRSSRRLCIYAASWKWKVKRKGGCLSFLLYRSIGAEMRLIPSRLSGVKNDQRVLDTILWFYLRMQFPSRLTSNLRGSCIDHQWLLRVRQDSKPCCTTLSHASIKFSAWPLALGSLSLVSLLPAPSSFPLSFPPLRA